MVDSEMQAVKANTGKDAVEHIVGYDGIAVFTTKWIPNPAVGNEPRYGALGLIYGTFSITALRMLMHRYPARRGEAGAAKRRREDLALILIIEPDAGEPGESIEISAIAFLVVHIGIFHAGHQLELVIVEVVIEA